MNLHQLQFTYQEDTDRILLRVSFQELDGSLQEIRAWLTRRFVKNLWPGIVQALKTRVSLDHPLSTHASAEILAMEHQASVTAITEGGNFSVPFTNEVDTFPIGETPILVTTAHFTLDASQPVKIHFVPIEGYGVEIAFPPTMLHGFCTLLQGVVKAAEWDIELTLPGLTDIEVPSNMLLN